MEIGIVVGITIGTLLDSDWELELGQVIEPGFELNRE